MRCLDVNEFARQYDDCIRAVVEDGEEILISENGEIFAKMLPLKRMKLDDIKSAGTLPEGP